MAKLSKSSVELFTADEHALLAQWFGAEPPASSLGIDIDEAVARLGFTNEPGYRTILDVAVAYIVLGSVEQRLPTWTGFVGDGEFVRARQYRDLANEPDRRVLLQPRLLFEINWADSGPGFSWPVAYYVTWLPYYDRFVVTASADSPDAFGYCDFALGSFGIETPVKEGSSKIIRADWGFQREGWDQQRWAYLFRDGLISDEEANALADEVWPDEQDDDEDAA